MSTLELPAPGDQFDDGLSPGFFWTAVDVDELDRIGLVLSNPDGEVTESYLQWPANRWQALVEKQLLTPRAVVAE